MISRHQVDCTEAEPPWEYEGDEPVGNRIGVALSGGGIRAAAFSLGALQALQQEGLLSRAHYLSAVSGGSYIAAGYVSTMHESDQAALGGAPHPGARPPWSPGSLEESFLYKNLGYLARGFAGRTWFFGNVLYGVVMNLLPLLCGSFVAGRLLGELVYTRIHPRLGESLLDPGWLRASVAASALFALGTAVTVLVRRLPKEMGWRVTQSGTHSSMAVTGALVWASVVCSMVGVVLPAVAALLNGALYAVGLLGEQLTGTTWVMSRFGSGAVLIAISLVLGGLSVLVLRTGRLRFVAALLAGIAGPLLLLTPCVLAIESSALREWSTPRDLPLLVVCVGVLLFFGFYFHNRRYSMHDFYRERLSEAFFNERKSLGEPGDGRGVRTTMSAYTKRILLSGHAERPDVPTLLIGAAVNASDRSVGFGSGAAPYVFAPERSGSKDLGWTETSKLEKSQKCGGSDLTLPAMVAISGAALSPVMGRLTVSSFRFLLALLNVRLGVWVPRPQREAGTEPDTGRLLARTDARLSRNPVYAALKRGWLEPGALYVLREGLGQTSLNSRFVYVTDGGHWENLGLYELARRRCTHILVFDASNNPANPLADFGRCCQLMFSRLGITVRIDPAAWAALDSSDPDSARPTAVGTIEYPDGAPPGVLVYCRSSLWRDAPHELQLLARLDGRFPRHSTTNQFLTADQFDAYRRLGWEIGGLAAQDMAHCLTAPDLDEPRGGASHVPHTPRFTVVA